VGHWKGIRLGRQGEIQRYDLNRGAGETQDVAGEHPETVAKIMRIMETAVTPHDRYPIGRIYKGGPVWKPM
jgi:hypothetical protein